MPMKKLEIRERAGQLLSLKGKVAIVTGAASGIGRGIAIRLAEMGTFVAVLDINERKGGETAAEIEARSGGGAFLQGDVRKAADCHRAAKLMIDEAGRIDILCNCAGIAIRKDVV